jgi:hypothetical protein
MTDAISNAVLAFSRKILLLSNIHICPMAKVKFSVMMLMNEVKMKSQFLMSLFCCTDLVFLPLFPMYFHTRYQREME